MDIVSRLRQFIDSLGLSTTQFADMAGIARPTLSQFLTGRNKKMSSELIDKLHQSFPKLNIMWLLFGDGEMATDGYTETSEPQIAEDLGLFDDQMLDAHPIAIPQTPPENSRDFGANRVGEPINRGDESKSRFDEVKIGISVPASDNSASTAPKRVTSIMVFYSDNSFEQFVPVK